MKIKPFLILTIFACLALAQVSFAQDGGMSDVEVNDDRDRLEREKIMYSPGESDSRYVPNRNPNPTPKDSIPPTLPAKNSITPAQKAKPTAAKSTEKQQPKSSEESILTFNFLYYIIEKYKLQDIVD